MVELQQINSTHTLCQLIPTKWRSYRDCRFCDIISPSVCVSMIVHKFLIRVRFTANLTGAGHQSSFIAIIIIVILFFFLFFQQKCWLDDGQYHTTGESNYDYPSTYRQCLSADLTVRQVLPRDLNRSSSVHLDNFKKLRGLLARNHGC